MRTSSLRTILRNDPVEDDARVRETLCTILATARDLVLGHVRSNGEDALANWTVQSPDVLILNINLPGVSGVNGGQQHIDRFPSVKILVHTVPGEIQRVLAALAANTKSPLRRSPKPMGVLARMHDLPNGGSPANAPIVHRAGPQPHQVRPAGGPLDAKLTEREREILALLDEGLLYKEISLRIGISESAIKQHIHRMYAKLHVQNRTEAVNRYFGR